MFPAPELSANSTTPVGRNVVRKEGMGKVLGRAQYIDDLVLPDMLHGATVRSTIARGRITNIIFSPTIDWSEFVIVTARDIPGKNTIVHLAEDHPCLADGFVNHPEEPILLIAHANKAVLHHAIASIQIDYEAMPAVFTIEESEAQKTIIWGDDNTFKSYLMEKGDVDAAFAAADYIVEAEYRTGAQEQLYIENNGCIAEWSDTDGITVHGSMQCPYYLHHALMLAFDLPADKCRVIQTETGGAFGGKEDFPSVIGTHAALLAKKAGRPVKIVYDRGEDMAATTKRHPSRTRHRTAVSKDGRLLGCEIDFAIDGGAYMTLSPVVLSRGTIHAAGCYHWPAVRVRAKAMATNVPPHGAFRGFGAPQSLFALERHMDKIAKVVGITPEELRRRNFLHTGDQTATCQVVKDPIDLDAMLTKTLTAADFHAKQARFATENKTSPIKRGMGFASFFHGAGFTGSGERRLNSLVKLEVDHEGRVVLLVSSTEFGQGTNTILCQVAAQSLNIPYEQVLIAQPDTHRVPNSGPTVASRTAMIVGKLVENACANLLATLRTAPNNLREHYTPQEFCAAALHHRNEHGTLEAEARYQSPGDIFWDDDKYKGEAYPAFGWAIYVAEVAVDTRTYQATCTNFWAMQEVGKVLHPVLAAGQIEGGVAQGIGYAIYEKCEWRDGALKNNQMTNYIMPTSADLPNIHVLFEEIPSIHGAFGAKGIGELPMDGPAPAILNAIEDALGIAFNQCPLLPEDVFERMTRTHDGGSEDLQPAIAGPYFSEATA
ncbi:aerobic-type carbon monoxide dehydrogenase, large subunit CoxL/CutL-like protein [Terriglobus roseus DSM 18391]|uniref:Aerobic-type carbon monoxide dehydrogenase, large subunit CoxL/CutL-like protein n=1 Tax=Terriglobus roseus (strain DSM 18391 / NRRL B-41598 / KBS 63) TaxID=926566 RepID=I3ZD59_TERRK|nr:xanthine dehydrogenase family protein molybdopterin-binding subunit [Terriglobus roseus]AFL87177.1 aerobic-type carbon monoxide dehydrogenase, large subunit CoxL/CutL-like protein [Terriglobus roseus DSM 18391]